MTLTDLSYYTRKMLPFAAFGLISSIILFYMFLGLLNLIPKAKTGPALNPIFGKIKRPIINGSKSSSDIAFKLDTVEGQPIDASAAAQVFFLPPSVPRFGYREKIFLMAKTLGFDTAIAQYKLIDRDASFTSTDRSLNVDISNFNFTYNYSFEKNPNLFTATVIPSKKEAENKAVDFLKSLGRYPDEFTKGKTNIVYLQYNPTTSGFDVLDRPQGANVVEIDFYRPDVDGFPQPLPIVSPSYFNSPNYVIMVFDQITNNVTIVRSQIQFFEKSDSQVGTYPLKTGVAAFSDLQKGRGIIPSTSTPAAVTIKKMFVGYLDPDMYQSYLQPVYVFLGENNFVGYVPAVDDSQME